MKKESLNGCVLARFWVKVDKNGPGGCWLWTAAKYRTGYGQVRIGGKLTRTHRLSYELVRGPIPAGLHIDHLCRVRHCVNPAHLEAVTPAENTRRGLCMGNTWNRGHTRTRGEKSGMAKLSEAQVLAIRADPRVQQTIADEYGIHQVQVSRIKTRKDWAWLPAHNEDVER